MTLHLTYASWWLSWCRAQRAGEDLTAWDARNELPRKWHVWLSGIR